MTRAGGRENDTDPSVFLKGKRVLLVGLGKLGGGVATANWLLAHGARLTVTDLRSKKELAPSLQAIRPRQRCTYVLGKHRKADFSSADMVVVNPAVPRESPFLSVAREHGAAFENDASLFFRFTRSPVIGITGTRGKTTTAHFIAQILSHAYGTIAPAGNIPENPLLQELKRTGRGKPAVVELSSWQLELLPSSRRSPRVSVITNIYRDHLNRYRSMTDYASAKARIFAHAGADDAIILNADNPWTPFFEPKVRGGRRYYFSHRALPRGREGACVKKGMIVLNVGGRQRALFSAERFIKRWGEHNLANLLAAMIAVETFSPNFPFTRKMAEELRGVPLRQEVVADRKDIIVINDSAGTSPDATIAALKRFGGRNTVLITGGTDKNLAFGDLAREIMRTVPRERLVLLEGSATEKLVRELVEFGYFRPHGPTIRRTLKACAADALKISVRGKRTVLFSPGAASFEKFRNEFDRGARFNQLVRSMVR